MDGMDVYVSEDDVRRYVAETLPRDKRSDWDIDAISRDVVAEWPDLVGRHPDLADMPGPDYAADWLDRVIQPENRYWGIVARHQVFRSAEELATAPDAREMGKPCEVLPKGHPAEGEREMVC